MIYFHLSPPVSSKVPFLQRLKQGKQTQSILKPKIEDNSVATIYNDDRICGGALLLGHDSTEYLLCFLEKEDYALSKAKAEYYLRNESETSNWTAVRPVISFSKYRFDIVLLRIYFQLLILVMNKACHVILRHELLIL